jgi:TP901 family phage tail tape measure protein
MSATTTQVAFKIVAKDKASKTFEGVGKKIAGAMAAIGIGQVLKDSIGLEAQFGKTMNILAASTGAPATQVKQLSDLALKLGADTTFSANEAADAMLELAKAGITTKDIMGGGVAGTLTLAAAGGTDLATAATIGSNAMNTFNLKGKDMAKIAAALAGGANSSSASVESLGQGLAQVGAGAVNAGLSLQETVGALSAFDAAGIKGSDAGTSLKTMLARLIPQTAKASTAMESVGLFSKKTGSAFVNANGSFKSMTQIAGLLHKNLSGLSEAQRAQALQAIFGSDATRAASVLMKQGADGLAKYIKATKDQTAAQKMADAAMSGTSGALERLKGSVETAELKIGQALAPAVQTLANGLSANLVPAIDKTISVISDVVGFLGDHKSATIAAAVAIGALVVVTKAHAAVLKVEAAGGLLKYLSATKLVTAVTKTWVAVQWVMNAALSANPIALIVIGVAALVAGIIIAYKKSETFRSIVQGAFEGVGKAVTALGKVGTWLWNSVYQPVFHFIAVGVSALLDLFGDLLGALGHVPGFGWAKDAANSLHDAADATQRLADNIRKIPDKTVKINIVQTVTTHGGSTHNSYGGHTPYLNTGQQP